MEIATGSSASACRSNLASRREKLEMMMWEGTLWLSRAWAREYAARPKDLPENAEEEEEEEEEDGEE